MKLPSMMKQFGEIECENRIYIEDYVYSYLNELKIQKETDFLRVALFGRTCSIDSRDYYFVYGAACTGDGDKDSDAKQVRETYFPEYEFLGYVKIRGENKDLSEKKKGYCVFYDTNEAMQNFLLSRYQEELVPSFLPGERQALSRVWQRPKRRFSAVGDIIKNFLYMVGVFLLAVAVTTINGYPGMRGFVETAMRAALVGSP